jgi:hypothetical protein
MFDAPFVADEDKLLFGNIGIEVKVRCRMFGSVMNTGGPGMLHDCLTCVRLIEKFGTCEYMHQAAPERCKCWMTAPRQRTNEQSVLQTESTARVRIRYWMKRIKDGAL